MSYNADCRYELRNKKPLESFIYQLPDYSRRVTKVLKGTANGQSGRQSRVSLSSRIIPLPLYTRREVRFWNSGLYQHNEDVNSYSFFIDPKLEIPRYLMLVNPPGRHQLHDPLDSVTPTRPAPNHIPLSSNLNIHPPPCLLLIFQPQIPFWRQIWTRIQITSWCGSETHMGVCHA